MSVLVLSASLAWMPHSTTTFFAYITAEPLPAPELVVCCPPHAASTQAIASHFTPRTVPPAVRYRHVAGAPGRARGAGRRPRVRAPAARRRHRARRRQLGAAHRSDGVAPARFDRAARRRARV